MLASLITITAWCVLGMSRALLIFLQQRKFCVMWSVRAANRNSSSALPMYTALLTSMALRTTRCGVTSNSQSGNAVHLRIGIPQLPWKAHSWCWEPSWASGSLLQWWRRGRLALPAAARSWGVEEGECSRQCYYNGVKPSLCCAGS